MAQDSNTARDSIVNRCPWKFDEQVFLEEDHHAFIAEQETIILEYASAMLHKPKKRTSKLPYLLSFAVSIGTIAAWTFMTL